MRRILVIGGGPAGYVAALRAAALGGAVTLVERDHLGGTCLNRGCIPTKALLESVRVLETIKNAAAFGIVVGEPAVDVPFFLGRKDGVVQTLRTGVAGLLRKAGVQVVPGSGRLVGPDRVLVRSEAGAVSELTADAIIVATGSAPSTLQLPGADDPALLNSDTALALQAAPRSIAIVGGGAVGLEFATIFHGLGARVTVIEALPRIAPSEDEAISRLLTRSLTGRGMGVFADAALRSIERTAEGHRLLVQTGDAQRSIEVERVLLAVGRRPVTGGLGLDAAGLRTDAKGYIHVDARMATSVPGIYAAGDVVGGPLLAHVAYQEGTVAAENAMGHTATMSYRVVPRCIFSEPEVAAVGMTEAEATAQGRQVRAGRFNFAASGKALAMEAGQGFVKVVTDAATGEVLGVHMVGPHATDLLGEAVVALELEATAEEIAHAIHGHPTLAEAVKEAAADALGLAVHK